MDDHYMSTIAYNKKHMPALLLIACGLFTFFWTAVMLRMDNPIKSLVIPASVLFIILSFISFQNSLIFMIIFSVLGADFGFDIVGLPKLYWVELMLIFTSGYLVIEKLRSKDYFLAQSVVNRPIFFLLGWAIISIIGSHIIGTTSSKDLVPQIDNLLLWSFEFLAFFIISTGVREERVIKKCLYFTIISSVPYLVFYFLKLVFIGRLSFDYENRVFSSFLGVFSGAYLMFIFILVLNHILYIKKYRFAMIILLVCLLFAMVETFWITSLIATTAASLMSIFFKSRKLAIGFFLGVIILFVYFAGNGKINITSYLEDSSNTIREIDDSSLIYGRLARVVVLKDAIRIVKEHFFFGVGMDLYSNYTDIMYLDRNIDEIRPMTSAHNEYAQVMVNVGVLGLPLLLWILYAAFKEAKFCIKNTMGTFEKYIGRALFNILIGVIVYSFSFQIILNTFGDGYFRSISASIYFWILLGLVVAYNNIIKQENGH